MLFSNHVKMNMFSQLSWKQCFQIDELLTKSIGL